MGAGRPWAIRLHLEVVPEARDAFVALLGNLIEPGLGHSLGALRHVERERRFDGNDDKDYQRADLCLWFASNDLVVVEVKTRWWPLDHVVAQLDGYAQSAGPVGSNQRPAAVVLLAPTGLAHAVTARKWPALAWAAVFRALKDNASPVVQQALKHWEAHVEKSFGIDAPFSGFDGSVQVVACLREFLRACAIDAGERPEDGLNLTGWAGEPLEWGGWKWHGISVPLRGTTGRRIGIYRYLAAPPGEADSLAGAWLELYRDNVNVPEAFMAFNPPDVSAASLDAARAAFRNLLSPPTR